MKHLTSCWQCRPAAQVRASYIQPQPESRLTRSLLDIIELGIPFTDPLTDGPTIQKSNAQALVNGVRIPTMMQMVRDARKLGLTAPILLMGYYNPVRAYGEEKLLKECRAAGVNGFIIVDLPPEEAIRFRNLCKMEG